MLMNDWNFKAKPERNTRKRNEVPICMRLRQSKSDLSFKNLDPLICLLER
jgi:hypothetical protein